MKKLWIVMAVLCLLMTAVMSVSADSIIYVDANNDGKVNNRDLGLLQRQLNA